MDLYFIFKIIIGVIGICLLLCILYFLAANQSKLIAKRDEQIKKLNAIRNKKKDNG